MSYGPKTTIYYQKILLIQDSIEISKFMLGILDK